MAKTNRRQERAGGKPAPPSLFGGTGGTRRVEVEAEHEASGEGDRREADRKAVERTTREQAERKVAEERSRLEAAQEAAAGVARAEADRRVAEERARREARERAASRAAQVEVERKLAAERARMETAGRRAEARRPNEEPSAAPAGPRGAAGGRDLNKVILQGVVSDSPRVRTFESGGRVVNLNVKTVTVETQDDGSTRERPAWIRVSVRGAKSAAEAERCDEGTPVYVEGEFSTRQFTNQEDQQAYWSEVRARTVRSVAEAESINRALLVGEVARVSELRQFETGQVLGFTVKTTEVWTGRDGRQNETVEWHRVSAWGELAERLHGRLEAGQRALVRGRGRIGRYTDREGVDQRRFQIDAHEVVPFGQTMERPSPPAQEPTRPSGPSGAPEPPSDRRQDWGRQMDDFRDAEPHGVATDDEYEVPF